MKIDRETLFGRFPVLERIRSEEEIAWINPDKTDFETCMVGAELTMADIEDAEARLQRFAPFIMKCFPETVQQGGIIESALTPIPEMHRRINEKYGSALPGKLLLKQDSHLAIAGSVKARGGIGIPAFVREDGMVTLDLNTALGWIGQAPVEEEPGCESCK